MMTLHCVIPIHWRPQLVCGYLGSNRKGLNWKTVRLTDSFPKDHQQETADQHPNDRAETFKENWKRVKLQTQLVKNASSKPWSGNNYDVALLLKRPIAAEIVLSPSWTKRKAAKNWSTVKYLTKLWRNTNSKALPDTNHCSSKATPLRAKTLLFENNGNPQ